MISATVIASLFGELNIYTWPILIQSLREKWKYIKREKTFLLKALLTEAITPNGVFGSS